FRDFLGSFVVADNQRPSSRQQSRKKTVAAADVQDALLVQIAKHLFDGRKMQPSAKRVIFDVVGVILHSAEVGHGSILRSVLQFHPVTSGSFAPLPSSTPRPVVAKPNVSRNAFRAEAGVRGKPQLTEWKRDPRMASAKMAGDRGDARTGLWSRDRGAGT